MAMTLTRPRSHRQGTTDSVRFAGNPHRRRPVVAVASLALVAFCVATFTTIYLNAGTRYAVLALSQEVTQGHTITSNDLTVVRISRAAGLSPVPASDVSHVVGKRAAVSLVPGTLLSFADLTLRGSLTRDKAVVGIATKAGQLPAGGVAVGDSVEVVLTGSPATLAGGASGGLSSTSSSATSAVLEVGGVLASDAVVTAVAAPSPSSPDTIVVSVLIPTAMAPLVASASAAGQAALVLVSPNS